MIYLYSPRPTFWYLDILHSDVVFPVKHYSSLHSEFALDIRSKAKRSKRDEIVEEQEVAGPSGSPGPFEDSELKQVKREGSAMICLRHLAYPRSLTCRRGVMDTAFVTAEVGSEGRVCRRSQRVSPGRLTRILLIISTKGK